MNRKKEPAPVEAETTAPLAQDAGPAAPPAETAAAVSLLTPSGGDGVRQGRLQIDGFGLPVNAIARKAVLAEMGEKEPDKSWTKAAEARQMTEKLYG